MESGEEIRPIGEIGSAFRSLVRPPLFTIFLVDALLAVVAVSIGDLLGPEAGKDYPYLMITSTIFFVTTSLYLQVAVTLAAGGGGGADQWIKAALRHRCFWRYFGTSLLVAFLVVVGAVALIVGAIVVGSSLVLSQPAVVLERRLPKDAMRRSAELTKNVRGPMAFIFATLWLPPLVLSVIFDLLTIELNLTSQFLVGLGSSVLGIAGTIAVTRAFVKLGGAPTPPLQTLLYKSKAGPRA